MTTKTTTLSKAGTDLRKVSRPCGEGCDVPVLVTVDVAAQGPVAHHDCDRPEAGIATAAHGYVPTAT